MCPTETTAGRLVSRRSLSLLILCFSSQVQEQRVFAQNHRSRGSSQCKFSGIGKITSHWQHECEEWTTNKERRTESFLIETHLLYVQILQEDGSHLHCSESFIKIKGTNQRSKSDRAGRRSGMSGAEHFSRGLTRV